MYLCFVWIIEGAAVFSDLDPFFSMSYGQLHFHYLIHSTASCKSAYCQLYLVLCSAIFLTYFVLSIRGKIIQYIVTLLLFSFIKLILYHLQMPISVLIGLLK